MDSALLVEEATNHKRPLEEGEENQSKLQKLENETAISPNPEKISKKRKPTDIKSLKATVHLKEGKDAEAIARRFLLSHENEEDAAIKKYITDLGMRRYNAWKGGKIEVKQKKAGNNMKLRAEYLTLLCFELCSSLANIFYESNRKKIPDLEEVFFYERHYLELIYMEIVKRVTTKRRTADTMKPISVQEFAEKSPTIFWNIYYHFNKDVTNGIAELHKNAAIELKGHVLGNK